MSAPRSIPLKPALRRRGVVPVVLVLLVGVVYAGSFGVPFFFDDFSIINQNRFMRSLWPPTLAMEAPYRSTAAGRPLVAYSFAVNYAVSGLEVWSYHLFNLLVHTGSVLLLYGVLRRTLALPRLQGLGGGVFCGRLWPALVASAWAVHPLNSETVVYISQRTELMMAFFVLASFACLLRAADGAESDAVEGVGSSDGGSPLWSLLAVVCGVLATLCK